MNARSPMNRELRQALKQAEARLAAGNRLSEARLDQLHGTASRLRAEGAGTLPPRLTRRLTRVTSTQALRTRTEPSALLAGLFDDVERATRGERLSRARVSTTWLEAPRSLVIWRRTAAAACVLAAISVSWIVGTDRGAISPERQRSQVERYALLDGVLDRYDGADGSGTTSGVSRNVETVGSEPLRGPRARAAFSAHSSPMQLFHGRHAFRLQLRIRPAESAPIEHN